MNDTKPTGLNGNGKLEMAEAAAATDYAKAVHMMPVRWMPTFGATMQADMQTVGPAMTAMREPDGAWNLHFKVMRGDKKICTGEFPFNADGPAIVDAAGKFVRWGIQKLGPGVWLVGPTYRSDFLHAFFALYDVPEPAPWLAGATTTTATAAPTH